MYQPPPLTKRQYRTLFVLSTLGGATCLVGFVAALIEIESIVISGLWLLLFGLLMTVFGLRRGQYRVAYLGLAHLIFPCLIASLIAVMRWSPNEAMVPVPLICAPYVVSAIGVTVRVIRRLPQPYDPNRCEKCGYLLFGLPTPRCPECGTPFDPTRLTGQSFGHGEGL